MFKEPLLEVKNLVTQFKIENQIVTAVDDISFVLHKGETIGIVGESGSGKSVTSLSAMGLLPNGIGKIAQGDVIYHGGVSPVSLIQISEKGMRKYRGNEMAMIFQEPMTSLNPVYTCGEQVMEAVLLHKKFENISNLQNLTDRLVKVLVQLFLVINPIRKRLKKGAYLTRKERRAKEHTIELFKQTKLPRPEAIFDSYPHQISGGQKQRVMIAMAMSCDPSVLIADEPTTALDVTVQKSILDLMSELQLKKKIGIIFITHDLSVIAELADKVIVMRKGKIVEQGAVMDIFTNPQHPYTKGLLGSRPPLDVRLRSLPTLENFVTENEHGELIEKDVTLNEAIKLNVISDSERMENHQQLYSQTPLLKVDNITVSFPLTRNFFGKPTTYLNAVDEVSFDLYPGETLGLVGESGCGKTTTGRAIIRLVNTASGNIYFDGVNLTPLSQPDLRLLRKDMQIIFQDPYSSLNPTLTVGEAILEPMRVHNIGANEKERKAQTIELLKRVGLAEYHLKRYPHEFSGGQRQRICIARALALKPKLVICDESVSALDVSHQAEVLNLLNELKKDFGLTYIFISHDLSVVKFMSDRMIVMQAGKIVEMGDADEIYNNPREQYTRRLIDAVPKGSIEDIQRHVDLRKNQQSIVA
ncbi:MAG: ABC transporter ATP-binding protein [Flavobacteriales bacterium]